VRGGVGDADPVAAIEELPGGEGTGGVRRRRKSGVSMRRRSYGDEERGIMGGGLSVENPDEVWVKLVL